MHLATDAKCQSKHAVTTFTLPNQKSEHQVLPGARHPTRMSEVGQVEPAAEGSVPGSSKGQPRLGSHRLMLPDLPILYVDTRYLYSYKIVDYKIFATN